MITWTDAHNHLQDDRLKNPAAIIAEMRAVGITGCVVNATREADWSAVEKLANDHPDFVMPAFGIHPWHADTATAGWQHRLRDLLENFANASIGECGLDRWVDFPPIETQELVFLEQLRIARELNRAATIHCLKAWGPLFDAFEKQPPPNRFLLHSFNGSIETAHRLIPLGAYFSFSGYFLQPRKAAVLEVFRQIPRDRILIETDAPDMLPPENIVTHPLPENRNHPANLSAIAENFAGALEISTEALADLTAANFRAVFGN